MQRRIRSEAKTTAHLLLALLLLFGALTAAPAFSQQSSGKAEIEKLNFLLGEWKLELKHENAPGVKEEGHGGGSGKTSAKTGPGGLHILMDIELNEPGQKFSVHEIFSWDPREQAYKNIAVNNAMPGFVVHTGRWEGKDLVFESKLGTYVSRRVWSDITESSHTYTYFAGMEGQPLQKVLVIFAKKS